MSENRPGSFIILRLTLALTFFSLLSFSSLHSSRVVLRTAPSDAAPSGSLYSGLGRPIIRASPSCVCYIVCVDHAKSNHLYHDDPQFHSTTTTITITS